MFCVCVPFIGIAVGVDRCCSWGVTLPELSRSLGANHPLTSILTKTSSGGKGFDWSSEPPERRMAATVSLTFLLLLLLHLAAPAPAPATEVKEVHSPALGEIIQVGETPL